MTLHRLFRLPVLALAVAIPVMFDLTSIGAAEPREAKDGAAVPGADVYPPGSPVALHGKLQVVGTQLCDEAERPVLLKGISTHDLKDFGRFADPAGVAFLARQWHVQVMRPALYVTSYLADRSLEAHLDRMVAACGENGIYCIIDWHVLFEKDPRRYQEEAREFFRRKADQYRASKHVLYEICNEPNGDDVTWAGSVKPFAESIIPEIRARDPRAVVIVGTPTWSQDVDLAAQDPLRFDNVLYAFHFYAGTHKEPLKNKVRTALGRVALFCTEWGTTEASGNGGPYLPESAAWLDFIEANGISWCNWSLSDASETSALFKPGATSAGGWTDADLTASGRFVRDRLGRH